MQWVAALRIVRCTHLSSGRLLPVPRAGCGISINLLIHPGLRQIQDLNGPHLAKL